MGTKPDYWVITAVEASADEHGLLNLHLTVIPDGDATSARSEARYFKVEPDKAQEVIDALLRVTADANPGATEA